MKVVMNVKPGLRIVGVCLSIISTMMAHPLWATDLDRGFDTQAQCLNVSILWETFPDASSYRLNYRALPSTLFDPWQSIDLPSEQTRFSADLWDGAHYEVYLQALGARAEILDSTRIARIRTGNFLLPPIVNVSTEGLQVNISWSRVEGAQGYVLSYSGPQTGHQELPVEPLSFSANLWPGASFRLLMFSIDEDNQISDPSQIHELYTGAQPDPTALDLIFDSSPYVQVHPARTNSPYAAVLQDCVYSETRSQSCSLARLPLLGQDHPAPTIDQIMNRVMVSDPWMAQRFQQVLEQLPTESLQLFRAVTGIVIASDVRFPYYWSMTGGIHLNPDLLWLTKDEFDTLPQESDPRQRCGSQLSYSNIIDYRAQDTWAYLGLYTASRTLKQITQANASILFHELTHANDVFPPAIQAGLSRQQTVAEAMIRHLGDQVSYRIKKSFPLHSAHLKHLARVRYTCANANCALMNLAPAQLIREFSGETANSYYSYSNELEDVAMIAEQILMSYFFGAERAHLLTEKLHSGWGDSYVYWGRIGVNDDPDFRAKAKRIMADIFPEVDFSAYIDRLPSASEVSENFTSEIFFPENKRKLSGQGKRLLKQLYRLDQLPYR